MAHGGFAYTPAMPPEQNNYARDVALLLTGLRQAMQRTRLDTLGQGAGDFDALPDIVRQAQ